MQVGSRIDSSDIEKAPRWSKFKDRKIKMQDARCKMRIHVSIRTETYGFAPMSTGSVHTWPAGIETHAASPASGVNAFGFVELITQRIPNIHIGNLVVDEFTMHTQCLRSVELLVAMQARNLAGQLHAD